MEIDYNELFGLEQGAEEQEVAEPAETEEEVSAKEQEAADPAVENAEEENVQSAQDNAKYAAARREAEAERDAAIKAAQEKAKADAEAFINEAFKSSGMQNPYTGKPITSKAEFEEYKAKYDDEQTNKVKTKAGLDDEQFDSFVNNLPEVKRLKEQAEQAQALAEQARKAQEETEIEKQLEAIKKLDPTVNSLQDILKLDTADVFRDRVRRGYSFEDAFLIANRDKITETTQQAQKQAALNAQSKEHLKATQSRGTGAEPVPADIKAQYRDLMPEATDAEILAHYNKYLTKKG